MSVIVLVAAVVIGSIGIAVVMTCYSQPAGHLERVVAEIDRSSPARMLAATRWRRWGGSWSTSVAGRLDPAIMRLLGFGPDRLIGHLVTLAAVAGAVAGCLAVPVVIADRLPVWSPVVLALVAAVLVVLARYLALVAEARAIDVELRHQLAGFLDVVTIVVAGNIGHEGALRIAAEAGDGRLFGALRQRIRESTTAGRSAIDAMYTVGSDLGLDELAHVAATIELAAAEGAPVVRALASTCSTLRSTLAAEHETEARLRTSRLTAPLIGMALIFMGLVIYPALQF